MIFDMALRDDTDTHRIYRPCRAAVQVRGHTRGDATRSAWFAPGYSLSPLPGLRRIHERLKNLMKNFPPLAALWRRAKTQNFLKILL